MDVLWRWDDILKVLKDKTVNQKFCIKQTTSQKGEQKDRYTSPLPCPTRKKSFLGNLPYRKNWREFFKLKKINLDCNSNLHVKANVLMKIQDSVSAYIVSFLLLINIKSKHVKNVYNSAASAMSLQSCPTLCDPIDGSPPGSPVPGILKARTLEWVAISFSNAWKWKVKVKFISRVRPFTTPWTTAHQAPPPMGFSRQEYWSGVPLPSPRPKAKWTWRWSGRSPV